MVRKKRLELLRLAAPEPKSGASTNFATSANCIDNLIAQIIDVMAGLQRQVKQHHLKSV